MASKFKLTGNEEWNELREGDTLELRSGALVLRHDDGTELWYAPHMWQKAEIYDDRPITIV